MSDNPNKFTRFAFKQAVVYQIPEHAVHISFESDEASEAFYDWFGEEGAEEFNHWLGEQSSYKHLKEGL